MAKKVDKKDEAVMKQFFKAGVSMACWSMGKLDKDGDEAKLNQLGDQLYSEFVATLKHKKEKE